MNRQMLRKLYSDDPTFEKPLHLTPSELSRYFTIDYKNAVAIYDQLHDTTLKKFVLRDQEISTVITSLDKQYPEQLLHLYDAPFVLYCLGNIDLLSHRPIISVIGTRNPSHEAMDKMEHIISPLIERDFCIVSGLAYGIDSLAHQITLQQKGKTIAVLGSGFHHIYPKRNQQLCNKIIEAGLVISEYPPDIKPKRWHFPERNRIISGISMATLVVEATEKSGTLITVDQALEQGKEVYAVPGSPLLTQTVGCHKMIQDGAKLVMDASDILEDLEKMQNDHYI